MLDRYTTGPNSRGTPSAHLYHSLYGAPRPPVNVTGPPWSSPVYLLRSRSLGGHTTTEQPVAKQTRSSRPRSRTQRRPDGPAAALAPTQVSDAAVSAAARVTTPAQQAEAHTS